MERSRAGQTWHYEAGGHHATFHIIRSNPSGSRGFFHEAILLDVATSPGALLAGSVTELYERDDNVYEADPRFSRVL